MVYSPNLFTVTPTPPIPTPSQHTPFIYCIQFFSCQKKLTYIVYSLRKQLCLWTNGNTCTNIVDDRLSIRFFYYDDNMYRHLVDVVAVYIFVFVFVKQPQRVYPIFSILSKLTGTVTYIPEVPASCTKDLHQFIAISKIMLFFDIWFCTVFSSDEQKTKA